MTVAVYHADTSLPAKLRRRLVRLAHRRPAIRSPERPMITFAFDDTPASAVRVGARLLEARRVRGTYYFCAGFAGETGHMGEYATREDMLRVAESGHEIGCHTFSHLDCGKASGPNTAVDIQRNAETLADWGVSDEIATFAYPYGDVGFPAKAEVANRFTLSRALHHGVIRKGVDLNQAPAVGIEGPDGEGVASLWIDRAAESQSWLILYTHGVESRHSPFGCSEAALARLLDRALERGFEVVTAREGAARVGGAA